MAFALFALVAAIALTACQGGSADPQRSPARRPTGGDRTPAHTAQPASRRLQPRRPRPRAATSGFIRSWYAKTGTIYLRFDRAILLTGKAADAASAAHGGESPVPNDYYIQNDNSACATW